MSLPFARIASTGLASWGRRQAEADGSANQGMLGRLERGQALIETALVLPLLLFLAFGVVAVGRITQAQMGVSAVAREAARAATLANNSSDGLSQGMARGQQVAGGYHLSNGTLQLSVEVGDFAPGGAVRATARYVLALDDLPLLGWASVPVSSSHIERIDLYRSRWPTGGAP